MNELLDITRREMHPANIYFEGDGSGTYHEIAADAKQIMFSRIQTLFSQIRVNQDAVKANFFVIGACLAEIERDKLYHVVCDGRSISGYSNFYKFVQHVFGFKKRTAANLIAVYRKFCNEQGLVNVEFINYSYSQLVELSSMDEYRDRISVQCSVRDIRHLKELYREYTPQPGTSCEDDLQVWKTRHKDKLADQNKAKNKIQFIPKKADEGVVQTSAPLEEIPSDEDEREVVTPEPEAEKKIGTEAVRNGLLHQLDLLEQSTEGRDWAEFVSLVKEALLPCRPDKIVSLASLVAERRKNAELKLELEKAKANASNSAVTAGAEALHLCASHLDEPIPRGVSLPNKRARENWLKDFRSWGIWMTVPQLDMVFYKFMFRNNAELIIVVGTEYAWYYDKNGSTEEAQEKIRYVILDKDKPKYDMNGISFTQTIEWLTKHAKEI